MLVFRRTKSSQYQDISTPSLQPFTAHSLLGVCLDSSQQSLRVSADNSLCDFAVLEDHERRHGADTELLGNVWDLIDVELDEFGGWEVL